MHLVSKLLRQLVVFGFAAALGAAAGVAVLSDAGSQESTISHL